MARLILFDDDTVVIETENLNERELEDEYGVEVVEIVPLPVNLPLVEFPTDRALRAE